MRSRVLKPDFFTNEELAHCEPLARILYAGLWCFSDKFGCFEWRPLKMKANIFPLSSCKIEPLLEQLLAQELIFKYDINGTSYGIIPTFLKHQSPHKDEKKSDIPHPSENFMKSHEKVKDAYIYINRNINRNINKKEGKKFGEFQNVILTDAEYEKLIEKLGDDKTGQLIENLSEYVHSKGKRYKSHYATILQWSKRDKKTGDSFGI